MTGDGNDIRSEVRELVGSMSPRKDPGAVRPGASLGDDLDFDSLTKMELAVAIERRFGLTMIRDEDVMDIDTVGDIEELVMRVRARSEA